MTVAPTSPQLSRARRFLTSGFLLLGLVVVLSVLFAARERADSGATQNILLIKDELSSLQLGMRAAESGQRGYLLTGNPTYLTTYVSALAATPKFDEALHRELDGGPDAAALGQIDRLAATKLAELAKTIALFRSGDAAGALALVKSNAGLVLMEEVRNRVIALQQKETDALQAEQTAESRNGWMMEIATAAMVLCTVLLAWFAIRENRLQNQQLRTAEATLIEVNEALESKVAERTRTLIASQAALAEANTSLEARVAERSRELDRIFKLSTDLLAVVDFGGRFRNVSPAWSRITGWPADAALSGRITDFVHPDDRKSSIAAFKTLRAGAALTDFENRVLKLGGGWCWLAWRAVPVPEDKLIYTIARDVTQEKAREEQLRQSQKMEVLGQLTGGIAHDFNNLLTVIMGSLELLQRDLKDAAPKLGRRVEAAMGGARRAAALTHRLLAFSRQQPLAPQPLDINRLLADMSDLVHRTLGEAIAVEQVFGAGLWQALADANQLENAVLNLAVNARDAMPDGGHITIETQNAHLDEAYIAGRNDVRPGQYVLIAITDTGTGMTEAVKDKVFEPFFTTKPRGQGTGLGLAQVYGFIKQSGGHIGIYSEPGHGTTVKLYLPRLRATPEPERPADDSTAAPAPRAAGETILLVEDEEAVREFSRETLEEFGYHVLCAENAGAAISLLDQNSHIDMLFTDVVLTGRRNGRQLADEVIARRPHIVVLFTTGYTRNAIIHHGRLDEGINFIGKPFTAADLARTVRRLFDNAKLERTGD